MVHVSAGIDHIRVRDAMHQGILSCRADTPLTEVAAAMARHHVHALVITDTGHTQPAGIVSDLDLAGAIASRQEPTAGQVAATEPLVVSADERLERAAQLMAEHAVAHLVVIDPADGHPIGVLSTFDLAAAFAGVEVTL